MAEDRIIKFCAQFGPKILVFDDKLSPKWAWSRSHDILIYLQMSVNIPKTLIDRMED